MCAEIFLGASVPLLAHRVNGLMLYVLTWNIWRLRFPPLENRGKLRSSGMTKAVLIEKIVEKGGFANKGEAEKALAATVEALREALVAGESVILAGFGTFKVIERAARKCRNPRTQEEMEIPACMVAKFTPGKQLKDALQK